jgi:uncharacterized protein
MIPQRLRLLRWYRGALQPGQATPLQIVMVQSTTFCNINCSYCYLPHRDQKGRFDAARLPTLLAKLDAAGLVGPQLTFVWHAGEPLSLPASYYEEAFEIVGRTIGNRCQVTHSFQTNATLVTPEYCRLFKLPGVKVGVSIDGPAPIHDRYRVTRGGRGTHAATMKGIETLKANGIPFTTISVVTADALDHADEIFSFLAGLGSTDLGFNIDEIEGENRSTTMQPENTRSRYEAFLQRLLELSLATPGSPPVRELRQAFATVQGAIFGQQVRSTENNPLSILSVGIDGRLATYSPELLDAKHPELGELSFGSIEHVDFERLFDHDTFRRINDEVTAGVRACERQCGYFDVCGGGAPSNKLAENGTFASTATLYCNLRTKATIDLVQAHLESRMAALRSARAAKKVEAP